MNNDYLIVLKPKNQSRTIGNQIVIEPYFLNPFNALEQSHKYNSEHIKAEVWQRGPEGPIREITADDLEVPEDHFEINKELVLSTCHVTEEDIKILSRFNFSSDEQQVRLHAPDFWEETIDFGENIMTLINLAKKLGCKWLVLDCDGPTFDLLPTFEW